ncbi:hypothetical protein IMCC3317_41000 [Kordia antarctica]|uniref:Uncharacterized protein n=1 Tax=Kordia antarctica TaxID=1218801 RepID=A0A7L4ZR82_9FLAO|nr:hypothetical protein [Kordia antarctica]QHI38706.1 hypothetical protein IMCC3317_41000 [Kordia antarctica]
MTTKRNLYNITPKQIYSTKGGFFDFQDPEFIYINRGLDLKIQEEIYFHESFHRTLSNQTIYGQTIICLSKIINHLMENQNDYNKKLLSNYIYIRNSFFKNMYFVQEGGAITRAFCMLPLIYSVNSYEDYYKTNENYFNNLAPVYLKIALYYTSFIEKFFEFSYVPQTLMYYLNETLTRFCMNLSEFKNLNSIMFFMNDNKIINDKLSPDETFFEVVESLRKNKSSFIENIIYAMEKTFKIDITNPLFEEAHRDFIDKKDVDGETLILEVFLECFENSFPTKSIPSSNYKNLEVMLNWVKIIEDEFISLVPSYTATKFTFTNNMDEKLKKLKKRKYFKLLLSDKN